MDMLVHWGVLRYLRDEIGANGWIVRFALLCDAVVLMAFTILKLRTDPIIVLYAASAITAVFMFQRIYLKGWFVSPPERE